MPHRKGADAAEKERLGDLLDYAAEHLYTSLNFESAQGGPTRYFFYVFWEATILVPHNSEYYTKQPTSSVSSREMPNLSVFCLLPFYSRVLCEETRPVRPRHEAREKCIHDLSSQVMEWSRPMFMTGRMTDHHRKSTTDHVTTLTYRLLYP